MLRLRSKLTTAQRDALNERIEYVNIGGEIQAVGATDGIDIGQILGQPKWIRSMIGTNEIIKGKGREKGDAFNKIVESLFGCE